MKAAYVTGADRGLGLALVRQLLQEGYQVFAGQYLKDWPELPELAAEFPRDLTVVPLNVAEDASVKAAARLIREIAGRLDLLINNAGIYTDRSGDILGELAFEDMRRIYETNTLGPLRVTHSVIDLLMAGTEKKLVNISSEAGSIGACWRKQEFGYTMSKSALNMQSALLRNHLKEYGIKVYALHPGWVRSYMHGSFNEQATVEAADSAAGLLKVIRTHTDLDGPIYYDYEGNELVW